MTILNDCQPVMHEGHKGKYRASGQPYEVHPIEVVKLYKSLYPEDEVGQGVCLIHDVIEDSNVTLRELKNFLGNEVAFMVDALSKRDLDEFQCRTDQITEYCSRLFTASLKDKRIAIIKLADRYHNVCTIEFLDRRKALRILNDTESVLLPFFRSLKLPMTGELASLCQQKRLKFLVRQRCFQV
jgi:(p)ppGpp synthase/HD superfamily hydrolase